MRPVPIAIRLASGLTLRGHEWQHEGAPVLLIHDLEEDLDVWHPLAPRLTGHGFRVIAVDLRGHGLSDGEFDSSRLHDDLLDLLDQIRETFGPVALVSHGRVAVSTLGIPPDRGAPVQVIITPVEGDEPFDWSGTASAMRLIISAALHAPTKALMDEVYPRINGQKLWVTAATNERGPGLLIRHPNLFEQLVIFLRRYLVPENEGWADDRSAERSTPTSPKDRDH